ncbi:hypothetical protein CHUAL_001698 [Chamberlinius hualienensis]
MLFSTKAMGHEDGKGPFWWLGSNGSISLQLLIYCKYLSVLYDWKNSINYWEITIKYINFVNSSTATETCKNVWFHNFCLQFNHVYSEEIAILPSYTEDNIIYTLKPTTITELCVEVPAEERYLLLRILEETFTTSSTIETVVEDTEGTVSHLSVIKYFIVEAEEVLCAGSILILKEPYIVTVDGRATILCGCPSDFIIVGESHLLYSLAKDVD